LAGCVLHIIPDLKGQSEMAGKPRELVHFGLTRAAHNAAHSRRSLEQTPGFHRFHPPQGIFRLAQWPRPRLL
jgi:hypothetical protein